MLKSTLRSLFAGRLELWNASTHTTLPLFAAVLLLATGLTTAHFIDIDRARAQAAARADSDRLAELYAAQVQRNLGTIDRALKTVKYAVGLKGQEGALPALNQQGLTPSGLIFTVTIANEHGTVVAANAGAERADLSREPAYRYHRAENNKVTFVGQVQRGAVVGESNLCFSRRLNDSSGRFAGMVIVAVDPAYFAPSFDSARQGRLGAVGLFGNDGVFRALVTGDKLSWGQAAASAPAGAEPIASSWDGVRRYTSTRALQGFPLTAMAALAESEQMAAFEARRWNYLWLATGAGTALVVMVGLMCAWSLHSTRARQRVRRAQQTLAAASEASLDAFFVLRSVRDREGKIVDFVVDGSNTRAENLVRMSKAQLHGRALADIVPSCRDDGSFDDLVRVTLAGGVHEAEWQWAAVPGRERWLHRQVVAVDGGVVAIVRDITERKTSEERIRHIAHHDQLTGLPNRLLVRDRLNHAIEHAERRQRSVALVFIDLDGFKAVNDKLGHNAGDELLKVVAGRMASCIRSDDTLGRFGGDEFVIVLPDQGDSPLPLTPLLETIRLAVNVPIALGGHEVQVGCSMGVAIYPWHGTDPTLLMMNADAAMYRAKELGRNNVQLCTGAPAPIAPAQAAAVRG